MLIETHEFYPGYWGKSERHVINLMKNLIEKSISKEGSLLDAGCGEGRLINHFEGYFSHIIAIDPDRTRIEKAKKVVKLRGFSNKVFFKAISINDLDETEKFDVVICSHVLQHVETNSLPAIMEKFSRVLKKDGLLFVTTCHSIKGEDCFGKNFLIGSEFVEERIIENEFNSLIPGQDQLPVHFFTFESLEQLLIKAGFDINYIDEEKYGNIKFWVFHVLSNSQEIPSLSDVDEFVNKSLNLRTIFGRDVFFSAKLYEW